MEHKIAIGMEPKYKQGKNPNSRNGFKKGNKSGNRKGSKHTEESKLKMSISRIGKYLKEKNPFWKGGLTRLEKQEKIACRKKPNKCEICETVGAICFDHDHNSGEFRGWICHRCNLILGLSKDNPKLLISLSKYLK